MPTGINWAYPHPGGLQMSLRMGFLNALTPVQGRLLDPKQGRRSESLDPHSGSQEGARGGRGEVLGTAASRVPGGLGRLCSAHLKCIQDTHVFWILFLCFVGFSQCCFLLQPRASRRRAMAPSILHFCSLLGIFQVLTSSPRQGRLGVLPTELRTSREGLSGVQTGKGLLPSLGAV